jgi:hypothetical protein
LLVSVTVPFLFAIKMLTTWQMSHVPSEDKLKEERMLSSLSAEGLQAKLREEGVSDEQALFLALNAHFACKTMREEEDKVR